MWGWPPAGPGAGIIPLWWAANTSFHLEISRDTTEMNTSPPPPKLCFPFFLMFRAQPLHAGRVTPKLHIFTTISWLELFCLLVSPSSTLFGEMGSVYPGFVIMIAIGRRKPYATVNRNQAQILYLYDVYWLTRWCCYGLLMNRIEIHGIHFQYQNNA